MEIYTKQWILLGKPWYPLVNKQKTIENGPVEIVDVSEKWCFSMVM